jgi:acetyl-CoA carboxylase carboxyl transferase subunit beta
MDWDFFAGSFGTVAGEKFQMASELAVRRGVPLVAIYTSSGVRQHENYAGLIQMQRAIHALETFKARSSKPCISVLVGQVWGGISASVAPLADLMVGIAGTLYGFSGPNVIQAYEGQAVAPGRQRVEAHLVHRNVDVVVGDEHEALAFLEHLIRGAGAARSAKRSSPGPRAEVTDDPDSGEAGEGTEETDVDAEHLAVLGSPGVMSARPQLRRLREVTIQTDGREPRPEPERASDPVHVAPTPEDLYRRYEDLVRSGRRPDAEFFTQQVFSDVQSFYNRYVVDDKLHYPAIIASVGLLGHQRFLVIGGQASYQRSADGVRRIPASPAPADYEYLERMLGLGERWELPVVFFTDTLGAKPTIAGEEQNQMFRIASAIARSLRYRYPVLTVVTGALGSGGGLTVGPNADWFAMLDRSLAFVAEARSAASILYKTSQPTREQVKETLATMRATAWDQKDLGLIDEVIAESPDPYVTAVNIHDALAHAYGELHGLSARQLRRRRDTRLRNPGGLTVRRIE